MMLSMVRPAAAQRTLTDLGALGTDADGASSSYPVDVNANGQVIGNSYVYDANHNYKGQRAFLYSNGQITGLGTLGTDSNGSSNSTAIAINAAGQVTGGSEIYDANHNYKGS